VILEPNRVPSVRYSENGLDVDTRSCALRHQASSVEQLSNPRLDLWLIPTFSNI
jgi:hypothetical protein